MYYSGGVWSNADSDGNVVSGKFSDGTYCYTVSSGIITSKAQCTVTLTVYAQHIGSNNHNLEYKINAGAWTTIGLAFSGCNLLVTIYNLSIGDTVYFQETDGPYQLSGSTTTCPGSAGCTYPSVYITGDMNFYLTVDTTGTC